MDDKDLEKRINDGIQEIITKDTLGSLHNDDFTRVWTDVVAIPLMRLEQIVNESIHSKKGYDKNQAVIYGLMIKVYKMLAYLRRIVCCRIDNYEICSVFNRIILEANVSLQYYVDHPDKLDAFRKNAAKPERKFKEIIDNNRASRGDEDYEQLQTWEDGLLQSINSTLIVTGIKPNEGIPGKINAFDMLNYLKMPELYAAYACNSHTVHCDWVDVERNCLTHKDGLYYPSFGDNLSDLRMLNPICIITCISMIKFLNNYPGHGITDSLVDDIKKELDFIRRFDQMHFNYLRKKSVLENLNDDS